MSRSAPTAITCRDVRVRFAAGRDVLCGVDLDVPAGSVVSLVGPSGCGKTTLLRCIAGLQRPTAGAIDPLPEAVAPGTLAYVFQEPALLPWLDAVRNVMLPLDLVGRGTPAERRSAAERWLGEVGFGRDDLAKHPGELSGGMKMRVSLARALVTEPAILLLDEPFAALDDLLRTRLTELLLDLHARHPQTMILVTHNIGEAILVGDEVCAIDRGRVGGRVTVDLPRPRLARARGGTAFGHLYEAVSDMLAEAAR
ncbi:MAG: ABC transporter ATP-binding protein [Planctomycetia bacterium]|nr:ABC transporter ATP-binding protein [Planctomycetia bacterium]